MIPVKLSVFVVSYNQEKYIAQAIESIVNQSILPYEIIICDDHSIDDTWKIITGYATIYPDLIKIYRNESNLGVNKNINKATKLTTGNIITCVAGDDYINPGFYEAIHQFIKEHQLNPDTESFFIISNIVKLLNTVESKYSNLWCNGKNLLKLCVRGLIDDRYGVVSRTALNNIPDFIDDIGIYADFIWNLERYINTEKVYFMDGYYPVYRIGVGIVSRTKEVDAAASLNKVLSLIIQRFRQHFDKSDLRFMEYMRRKNNYVINKSVKNYFSLVYHTLLNTGNFYSVKKQIKALTFILLPKKLKKMLFRISRIELLSK